MTPNLVEFATEADWLQFRKLGLGGSDAAASLGLSKWQSMMELWAIKANMIAEQGNFEKGLWGKKFQPLMIQEYAERTGHKVRDLGIHTYVSKEHPWRRASVDGLVITGDPGSKLSNREQRIIEAKATAYYRQRELEEEIPLEWEIQIQHNMSVVGLDKGTLVVLLNGNELFWRDIERNDKFVASMIKQQERFWKYVTDREQPPVDASDSAKETLAALYPKDSGEIMVLGEEFLDWDRMRLEGASMETEGKRLKQQADNQFRAAMGSASFASLPDGTKYSYKLTERVAYKVDATEFRQLRRLK